MAIKSKILAFIGTTLFALASQANQYSCPELTHIKAEGLSMAAPITKNSHFYAVFELSEYHTSSNWGFVISPVEAASEEEAIRIGNGILHTMNAPGTPSDESHIDTVCLYDTGRTEVSALARTGDFHALPAKIVHIPDNK